LQYASIDDIKFEVTSFCFVWGQISRRCASDQRAVLHDGRTVSLV